MCGEKEMQVKLNGQMIELEAGKTAFDAAFALDPAVAREALCCLVGEEVRELTYVPSEGDEVTTLTFADERARKVFWHTTSHVLAQAVKRLFPEAKLAIGTVAMNRMDSVWFDDTLDGVLNEQHQFPIGSRYDADSLSAAHEVLSGRRTLARNALYYQSPGASQPRTDAPLATVEGFTFYDC